MSDTTRVVYEFTEKGLDQIKKLVDDLRKEINNSGADVGQFESRLDRLESTVQSVSKALQGVSSASKTAGNSGKAAGDKTAASWKAAKDQIDAAIKVANKGINAGTAQQVASSPVSKRNTSDATNWDAQFKAANESAKKFEAQQEQIRKEAAETAKQWALTDKNIESAIAKANKGINAASTQQASSGLASKKSANAAAIADWDAQFKAATRSAADFEKQQNAIITSRYALYDVATTYTAIGVALAGVATYATIVGARFESAFTTVERTLQTNTTAAEVQEIRSSLVDLSTQIPLTFQQISEIATIGNQMGIAKDDVVDFTGTIARFASVSGLSVDAVTQAFGTLMAQTGLAPKYLENIGSAIAKVGIDSNASEAQILSLTKEITAGAKQAGLGADQIVGLAGSLASLGIAPERARGSLSTYFGTLNKAVAEGGADLKNFAQIVGVTTDQLTEMVRTGQGADVLRGFLEGLADLDNVDTTTALNNLNLAQLRVSDTFTRLSDNLKIYDRDQENAHAAFLEGAELQRQYAKTLDDLNTQWQLFINGINAMIDTISGGAIPGLAALLQMVNGVIKSFTDWLGDNRWAQTLLVIVGVLTTLLAVLALFRGGMALAQASMLAFAVLQRQAAAASVGATIGFRSMTASLFGVTAAAGTAARSLQILRAALISTGVGALAVGLGLLLENLLPTQAAVEDNSISMDEYDDILGQMTNTTGDATGSTKDLTKGLKNTGGAAKETAKEIRTLIDYANDLAGVFSRASDLRFGSQASLDQVTSKWIDLNDRITEYESKVRSLSADKALKQYWLGIAELYNDQVRAGQLRSDIADIDDEMANAQANASTELKGNSKAAIQNRQAMLDLLGSSEDYIRSLAASGASQKEINRAIAEQKKQFLEQGQALGFSRGELDKYAKSFDDMAKIVKEVPKDVNVRFSTDPARLALNEFFAKAKKDAAAAGGGVGGALGGGITDGLLDALNANQDDYLDALKKMLNPKDASDGAGNDAGQFFSDATREKFRSYGAGIIYDGIKGMFDWATGAVKDPAIKTASNWINGVIKSYVGNDIYNWILAPFTAAAQSNAAYNAGWKVGDAFGDGAKDSLAGVSLKIGGGGKRSSAYATGGYTGPGHWLQPAGVVHKGEYVVPKKHVNQHTGLPDMNYMARLTKAKSAGPGYAMGGHVGGGTGLSGPLELGPATLHYLGQVLNVRLGVDGRDLAYASSSGDRDLAWAGSN